MACDGTSGIVQRCAFCYRVTTIDWCTACNSQKGLSPIKTVEIWRNSGGERVSEKVEEDELVYDDAPGFTRALRELLTTDERQSLGDVWIDNPFQEPGFIFGHLPDGRVATNVPHAVIYHSPTGYETGYGGSGPADLALNILVNATWPIHASTGASTGVFKAYRGECSLLAWELHQAFKWQFIAGPSNETGNFEFISLEEVEAWIISRVDKREQAGSA